MIFEILSFQATLLGEEGKRIVNIDLGTRICKGFVSADNEVLAARKVGLVKVDFPECEESLREWADRYWFPRGTRAKSVLAIWQKTGKRPFERGGVFVFVVSAVAEIAADHFAKE